MDYKERTSSELTIWRSSDNMPVIENVPITMGSTRKFHLMSEDSVTLAFSLPNAVYFRVGDYIIDELFGKFILREEQMPRYNTTTSGYDYTLRFDSDYWLAENHILMLTTGGQTSEQDGVYYITGSLSRKETTWSLTGTLLDHALMVIRNYKALRLRRAVGDRFLDVQLRIDNTAAHAGESKHLAYDGVCIISALNQIANEFECEWWFEDNVLHFGKCGGEGDTQFDFWIGDHEHGAGNVESMEISRNQNTYANRLYALGSTKNIPDSYGKKLMLDIQRNNDGSYQDGFRRIDPYTMLNDEGTQWEPSVFRLKSLGAQDVTSTTAENYFREDLTPGGNSVFTYRSVAYKDDDESVNTFGFRKDMELSYSAFSAGIRFLLPQGISTNMRLEMRLFLEEYEGGNLTQKIYLSDSPFITTYSFNNNGRDTVAAYIAHRNNFVKEGNVKVKGGRVYKLVLEGKAEFDTNVGLAGLNQDYIGVTDDADTCMIEMPAGISYAARVVWNGIEYPIVFNPLGAMEGEDNSYSFRFTNAPSGLGSSETVELLDYNPLAIPFSYWTEEFDNPSSMLSLGERRLHLPLAECPYGYVQKEELCDEQIVEQLVRAEDIYPRCYLRVTSVETEDRDAYTEYSDGTKWNWPWKAYKVTVEQLDGQAFPFKRKYVQEGEKLQALFLSEMDTERAYDDMLLPLPSYTGEKLLAGMTYDIGFTEMTKASDNTYTLIRNNDYGTMLPNDTLCPTEGDLMVLIGWDVRAMEDLGLISTAERNLHKWAGEYLDAIEEGQWTFTCHMMSDWPFILFGDHQYDSEQFIEADGKDFDDSEQRDVYVRLGKNKYGYVPFRDKDAKWFFAQDKQFYVRNTEYYILPTEGARVRVIHDALKDGEKKSRVIGYELKLDKPFDSPTYTVGETNAYSRIRELEKKLNTK